MAVQYSKKSRSRAKMRRTFYRAGTATVSEDSGSGEMHLRHNITANGYYRGKQVVVSSEPDADDDA